MSQKFRVKQMRVKSESANRSGIVTENMTSATPDQIVWTIFKNVQVNENGEFVVWPNTGWGWWVSVYHSFDYPWWPFSIASPNHWDLFFFWFWWWSWVYWNASFANWLPLE